MWRLALAGLAACGSTSPALGGPATPLSRTQLVFLGTGGPPPDPARSGPATAVVVDGVAYMFDAGPGVARRAMAASTRFAIPGLAPARVRFLFITHLHSDHTLGYPDLLYTGWVTGRTAPLEVYGPPGIGAMTEHVQAAWAEDVAVRSEGLEHKEAAAAGANVHEVAAGVVFKDERVTITAVAVKHGSWKYAFGYRIDGPDRSILITGDHAPSEGLAEACNGCDVLVSEAYSTVDAQRADAAWRTYLAAFHTSGSELGALATSAHAKQVIVTHRGRAQQRANVILDEIRTTYAGPASVANDLERR